MRSVDFFVFTPSISSDATSIRQILIDGVVYFLLTVVLYFLLSQNTVASALIERAEANHYRLSRTNANSLLKQVQVAVRRKSKDRIRSQKLALRKKKEKVNFGCVPSDEVCVYCWVRLPGQKAYQLGRIATDRVTKDPEFVCVFVQAEYHVVSILDIAIAGVKDRKESIDDLL